MSLLKVDTIRNRSNSGAPEFDLGLNVISGISSLGGVRVSAGIVTSISNTGIVTYFGDGSGLTLIPNSSLVNSTISGRSLGTNLQNLTPGSYITGSNYNGGTARTFAVDATSSNTANKVVARNSSGDFSSRYITATQFRRLNGTSSQFLKADGSIDSNSYLTSADLGGGTLTIGSGSGISLSSNPTFDANQNANKTITISTNATAANTSNTLVSRDSSGGISIGALSAASANLSGNVTASGFLVTGQSGFLKADGTVDTTSYLSNGNIKDPQITLTASGSGFSLGSTQSFTLNQASAATIAFSINSSTGNTGSTLVFRDANGDFASRDISARNFDTTSDATLKTDILKVDNALDILESISGVSFKWKGTGEKSMGILAQEVEEVLPELINNSRNYKAVNYNGLIAVLIESIKELKQEIKQLKDC
tara:strand:- start:5158 stop:6429 length:1272 start_codon:yes stop_codon:yes gene_type:complete